MTEVPTPPQALQPLIWSGFHEPLILYEGPTTLTKPSRTPVEVQGRLFLSWLPSPTISYRAWSSKQGIPEALDPFVPGELKVEFPHLTAADLVKAAAQQPEPETPSMHASGMLSEIVVGDGRDLKEIRFNVINFDDVLGSLVAHQKGGWTRGRLTLVAGGWVVTLDGSRELSEIVRTLRETGGYAFSHVARLEREDGRRFSSEEAEEVFDSLFHLLAFARGALVGIALPIGRGPDDAPRWGRLGTSLVDAWRPAITWFDRLQPQVLEETFPKLVSKCGDVFWGEVIRRAIRYYVDANDPRPVDRAIVISQAALELLSWSVVVEDQHLLSASAASHSSAASRIMYLLRWAGIPTDVPPSLSNLMQIGSDGPEAFATVRNRLAHPKRTKPPHSVDALIDAWLLGQWWVELCILRILGFNGVYANRLVRERVVGQVESVPWS